MTYRLEITENYFAMSAIHEIIYLFKKEKTLDLEGNSLIQRILVGQDHSMINNNSDGNTRTEC